MRLFWRIFTQALVVVALTLALWVFIFWLLIQLD